MLNNWNRMSEIEKFAKIWQIQLNVEYKKPQKNIRISFKDVGPFCEYLALDFAPGYQGGGSGGMGYDLYNKSETKAIEVKSCCTIQNWKCKKCDAKFNNLFMDHCPDCGGNDFDVVGDSRFSINAREILRQYDKDIFGGFIFSHISEQEQIKSKNVLVVKVEWFKLNFDDDPDLKDIRLAYFINQRDKGAKDNNNLLPYSFDFYKLAPQKVCEMYININYADLNAKPKITKKLTRSYPRVDGSVLRKKEYELFKKLDSFDPKTNTAEARDFTLNIPYRNKSLGKDRGDTRARLDKALKNKVEI